MKKLFVLSTAAFCFFSVIKAQGSVLTVSNGISNLTIQQFYEDFGNLPIVETAEIPGFDKITFLKDGAAEIAYYDASFDLVGTIAVRAFEDLPKNAQDYIGKHYNDYTVSAVRYFDDNEANNTNMYMYDQQFVEEDSYFVELEKDNKTLILHVTLNGTVYPFNELK